MKFNCIHRTLDESIKIDVITADNRHDAFRQASALNWIVVEMRPFTDNIKPAKYKVKKTNTVKIPTDEELEILLMRRNAFWIGVWFSWLPLLGWLIAAFASFIKYDMRGLKCCVYGTFLCTLVYSFIIGAGYMCCAAITANALSGNILLGIALMIGATFMVLLAIFLPTNGYRKEILKGFTLPKNLESRL